MDQRTILLPALLLVTIGTQASAAAQPTSSERSTNALIIGQVLDSSTGSGVGGALVTLSLINDAVALDSSSPRPRTVVSTADGRYVFRDLSAGRYTIGASKPGYIAGGFGTRRPGAPRQLLVLADGQKLNASPIGLWRHAALSGLVVDDGGEPVVGATVRALRQTPPRGREFGPVDLSATTDDRGIYRIARLPPGDYLVLVCSISDGDSLLHPTTFYGSAPSPEQATIVTVATGDDRAGVDFVMPTASGFRVRGTIQDPSGPAAGLPVKLRWPYPDQFPFDLEVSATVSRSDGSFSFDGVAGGTYVLEAASGPTSAATAPLAETKPTLSSDRTLRGQSTIAVSDQDVDDVLLQLSPGARVSGRVIFEGGAPALVAATSVFLDRVDQRPLRLGPARPDRAGQFTTTDFPPGKYRLRVGVIPAGWMFKSAMYEGRDIADEPFDLESADVKGVVVAFTTRGTRLSGAVRSERGRPDPETSVLLYPCQPIRVDAHGQHLAHAQRQNINDRVVHADEHSSRGVLRSRNRRGNVPRLAGSEAPRGTGVTCDPRSHRRRPDARAGLDHRSRSITRDSRLRLPTQIDDCD